ncbi:hypothetical protein UYSO10_0917 [Kosakonia radicincitans]|nr:hypothetical protein UYSO10_0917 [Kosakonia radicincitans]
MKWGNNILSGDVLRGKEQNRESSQSEMTPGEVCKL